MTCILKTFLFKKPTLFNVSKKFSSKSNLPPSSFCMDMFLGKIDDTKLIPFPQSLKEEQHEYLKQLIEPANKYIVEKNDPLLNDKNCDVSQEQMKEMGELGFFGLQVPEQYGGLGLNNQMYARLVEIIGANDLALGIVMGAHQSIGYKGIVLYGNEKQKEKYLPQLASGAQLAAYCLTEPGSGSDAASIKSNAVKSPDNSYYTLNGNKLWISNGGIADIFTVFAKTKTTKNGVEKDRISAFIVERKFGGITHSPPEKKMGIRCSNTAALYFDNVKIPAENLLHEEGEGFKVAMNILNNGRFGMACAMSGCMRSMIQKAASHCAQRSQFGSKLSEFGSIQHKLTQMAALQYVTESMGYYVSGIMDNGAVEYQVEAAISKIYGSESAWHVTDETIQILGGIGFMSETGVEKVLRDLRIFRIFEGANDILRLFAAGTSLMHAGKMLQANKFSSTVSLLGSSFKSQIGIKQSATGSVNALLAACPLSLHSCVNKFSECVGALGATSQNLLVKHQKSLINRQIDLIAVANMAIECFSMAVILSRVSQSYQLKTSSFSFEEMLVKYYCDQAHKKVFDELDGLSRLQNYETIEKVSREICNYGGLIHQNPLGY